MSDDKALRAAIRRNVAHAAPKKDMVDRIDELIEEGSVMAQKLDSAEAKLARAVDALDEAVYLLRPDEKDMMRKAGVYRIVTTLAELKGQNDE